MVYDMINSHTGRIKVNPNLSKLENCLNAVEECDLFLGIIRLYYGIGDIGDLILRSKKSKKPLNLENRIDF